MALTMNDWTVIGYNTQDLGLPLFKVGTVPDRKGYVRTVKEVQDDIAADQAMRYPHIIYTVVPTKDLWW